MQKRPVPRSYGHHVRSVDRKAHKHKEQIKCSVFPLLIPLAHWQRMIKLTILRSCLVCLSTNQKIAKSRKHLVPQHMHSKTDVTLSVGVVGKAEQEARFANSGVTSIGIGFEPTNTCEPHLFVLSFCPEDFLACNFNDPNMTVWPRKAKGPRTN